MESNDSPEFPDRGETSDIPALPSGGTDTQRNTHTNSTIEKRVKEGRGGDLSQLLMRGLKA